jgi:GNAT acetyltransferase-like protein
MGAPFAGRGYMTEAIQLLLSYAFSDLKLHRIEANIQPHNTASIALVKRAAFTNEGYSRKCFEDLRTLAGSRKMGDPLGGLAQNERTLITDSLRERHGEISNTLNLKRRRHGAKS